MNHSTTPARGILLGGFFAGLCDFLYPTLRTVISGGPWWKPWKGVASGLLGKAAMDGGTEMAILGAALHWIICFGAAAILYLVASRLKFIPRQWVLLGVIHGIAVLLTMNYVILPLSAIGQGIYPLKTLYINALFHILWVGLPTAFFVSRALKTTDAR